MTEREKFEAAMKNIYCGYDFRYIENSGYIHETIDDAYIGWKACAESKQAELDAANAKIDRLMLEYCPEDMSAEQMEEWGKHQKIAELTPKENTE